jgi:hypothetical protein
VNAKDVLGMPKGMPRPVVLKEKMSYRWRGQWEGRRFPLPYTAQKNDISLIHEGRAKECVKNRLCFVCGETVDDPWALANERGSTDHGEAGPYHELCATITLKMCPHVNEWGYTKVKITWEELESFTEDFW